MDDGQGERIVRNVNSTTDAFTVFLDAIGSTDAEIKAIHGIRSLFITTAYDTLNPDLSAIHRIAGHSTIDITAGYISGRRWSASRKQKLESAIYWHGVNREDLSL